MGNKQQTAVEWLVQNLKEQEYLGVFCTPDAWGREEEIMKGIVEQAKEMEKQQIAKAFDDGDYNYHYSRKTGNDFEDGKEYFKEVYG